MFNDVQVVVPRHAAAGTSFEARLLLVPYSTLGNVTVRLRLSDRYFAGQGQQQEQVTNNLETLTALKDGRLPGRRATQLSAWFRAPYPVNRHASARAEMTGQVLGLLSVLVPALKFAAANHAEHGGFYVEAYVRVGLLSRRYHKRIVTYYLGQQILVG
jgi:hypothetical protein